nr:hypothetical protein [Tanacetum cinerariifolium]
MDPPTAPESHKRGHDRADVNAPPKSLWRDYADPPPSESSHWGKSLTAIQLGMASSVVPEDAPVGVSDPDPMSFADASSRHPADVAQYGFVQFDTCLESHKGQGWKSLPRPSRGPSVDSNCSLRD